MPPNDLIRETSPYLLQHAQNPVQWHAWNDYALALARDRNMPIFLSVGYSACHWCHVMAHESFENAEIAKIMNENFVNIKVDREERPDIDDIYQKACQIATGQGGWPLSVFLTPDQRPFYVGTYFPVLDSYGRPGFGSVLARLAQAWKEKPGEITQAAEKFLESLRHMEEARPAKLEKIMLDEAATNLLQLGDMTHGGFGRAPKFPNSASISFMFRYARLSGISKFTEFALLTLKKMARGGIFDQIGGGFHRYSTDARWLVPHFEKMLYDNALIPVNYAEAYQITGDRFYLGIMEKTLDYVLHEMASPEGGFYSSQDADTGGEEGRFYVWTKSQVREALDADADAFCLFYDITDGGNWEGKTILANNIALSAVAFQCNMTEDDAREAIEGGARKLLERRAAREAPGLDDKILASWNALVITALARGYRVSGEARYLESARRCIDFMESAMSDGPALFRTYKDGRARIPGYLDDHAYYMGALLDVFEVSPEARYLERASELGTHIIKHFWDPERGAFFLTADDHEGLIIRPPSGHDLSLPSGSSVAAHALLRLYHFTHEKKFLDVCVRVLESHAQDAAENPFGFGYLLNTIYLHMQRPSEITVINPAGGGISGELAGRFLPEALIVTVDTQERLEALSQYPFFAGKKFEGHTTVFVCRDSVCSLPLRTLPEVEKLIS